MILTSKLIGLRQILFFDNFWQLLLQRLFFRKTALHVYRLGSLEFIVDHSAGDANGVREVIVSQMYRGLIPKMALEKNIALVDIGSYTGGTTTSCIHGL